MSWLAKLFGQCGKIRYEVIFEDGSKATVKQTIEAFGIDNDELIVRLKDSIYVETGKPVKSITLLGFSKGSS